LNRRAVALGLVLCACTPAAAGERFLGVLRLGFEEALFWPRGREDGPWWVEASAPVMATIEAAVKAANGGFAWGGMEAEVLGTLSSPAPSGHMQAAQRRLTVLKLLRSGPESFTARG
jgi:hypothetical protein